MNPTMAAIRDKDDAHPLGVVGWRSEYHAMRAALDAVLALHRPCDNDAARTPICETCHGKAGVWECGCWADEDRVPVCSTCTEVDPVHDGHGATPWPCPTVRAVTAHLDIEPR